LELIKGEIVMLPPPDKAHQKAIDRVIKLFAYHIREIEALGCVIGGSNCFFEVPEQFRAEDGSGPSDIFPDASIHYEDYHDTTRHPAALLVVEVLSTSNRENLERDLILKQEIYAALEMPAYWIIDRRDQSVWVHTQPCAGQYTLREQMKGAQVLSAPGLEFLQITPARIFSE
jgi:Uma2 family endonuclease